VIDVPFDPQRRQKRRFRRAERSEGLREVEATPPWPEFNQAITTAIGQWLFEPTVVEGRHVPVCMAVTVGIVLQ
jgi:hypothetical protein